MEENKLNQCDCGKCGLCKAKDRFFAPENRKKLLLQAGVSPIIANKALSLYPNATINKNAPDSTPFEKTFDVGLYISGNVGVGKSVSACCIMLHDMEVSFTTKEHRNHTRTYKFITCGDLFEEVKSNFNSTEDIRSKYRNVDFLIIDDLGTEKMSEWAFSTLYSIVDYRYGYYKTTIYTSNYGIDQIARKLDDQRIPRRIKEVSKIIKLS